MNIIVKDGVEEEDMKEYFSQYGTITDIVRMKDKETGNLIHYVKRDFNIEKQLPCCL